MKKIALILVWTISFWAASYGQEKEVELNSLSFSAGTGSLSNEPFFEAGFSRGNDIIGMYISQHDQCAYYLKSYWKDKLHIGPMMEYYYNSPTLGAMGILNPIKNITATSWFGFSAGHYGQKIELTNWQFLFFWQQLDYNYKRFTATGVILHFEAWHKILDFKYKQPLNDHFSLFTSAGYDFYGKGKNLLKIGITYVP